MSDPLPFSPISNYGLIGNCHTAALVSADGSIDWACFPRFDSPSAFAAILDPERGGRFSITAKDVMASSQHYVPGTNVLQTEFTTPTGNSVVTDFMPVYSFSDGRYHAIHQIVRKVECTEGQVELTVSLLPQPDYGRATAKVAVHGRQASCEWNDSRLLLTGPVRFSVAGGRADARLTLQAGGDAFFTLTYSDAGHPVVVSRLSQREQLDATIRHWQAEAGTLDYDGMWRNDVLRSYLALRLMTFQPTGGIVAAPTTSLPEEIGGVRNWDYRYTWLRDASFTVDALLAVGHEDAAIRFFEWLCRVCATNWDNFQIMYRVDGSPDIPEEELAHLSGYRGSSPVRIGNGAYRQVQHDIYGEVLASAYLLSEAGQPVTERYWKLLETMANHAASRWRRPDSGIWEIRGGPFHFIYSKVMCWVALDRAIRLAERASIEDAPIQLWHQEAQAIRREVLDRGWSERKQAFVQHYDTEAMDASNLLMPLVGFIEAGDPRMVSTVERIREELGHGPFLHRYDTADTDDGLPGSEGAFTLCSFWLVRVLVQMGMRGDARALFQRLIAYASPLGLYSEMVEPEHGAALGNFPQAFTHIGLILAARECGLDE